MWEILLSILGTGGVVCIILKIFEKYIVEILVEKYKLEIDKKLSKFNTNSKILREISSEMLKSFDAWAKIAPGGDIGIDNSVVALDSVKEQLEKTINKVNEVALLEEYQELYSFIVKAIDKIKTQLHNMEERNTVKIKIGDAVSAMKDNFIKDSHSITKKILS